MTKAFENSVQSVLATKKPHDWSRKLNFYPERATFEGFLETETSGFFDSSDCPPPELWEKIEDNILTVGVPETLVDVVDDAVLFTVNDTLEWALENVSTASGKS